MASTLTVDIFVSVDGWAGSEGLPGYFGYLGPDLEEWITGEGAAPQLVILGRRTYQALAELPDEANDDSWHHLDQDGQGRVLQDAEAGGVAEHPDLRSGSWSARSCG